MTRIRILLAVAVLTGALAAPGRADAVWTQPRQIASLAVVADGGNRVCELRLADGEEFAFTLKESGEDFLAALLLSAFRESAPVRILSDPQVVVLYGTGLGAKSLKKVKALGAKRER